MSELPDDIDPLIYPVVKWFVDAGFRTFASCQGGEGHAMSMPWIRLAPRHSLKTTRRKVVRWLVSKGIKAFDIEEVRSGFTKGEHPDRCYVDVYFWSLNEVELAISGE